MNWSRPSAEQARAWLQRPLAELMRDAAALRDAGHGRVVTYSRKVFIPLTELCRDVCHYCTYAKTPRRLDRAFLTPDEVLEIARAGERTGCHEALFTLGDKPELRYRAARSALAELGYARTVDYLRAMAELVREETGLLPHLNPGVLSAEDYALLRPVAASMGIMLESSSARLSERGGPHFGSPDKLPAVRLAAIDAAGEARVPLTSGILIGIGETRDERIDSLLALRASHERYGHLQEIIVQNFLPKRGTKMAAQAPASRRDLLQTIALARLIFGPDMSVQAPPNLSAGRLGELIAAGLNDWGGVSPVTPDHVNPEAPWPQLELLAAQTASGGKQLTQRLTIYPRYIEARETWLDPRLEGPVLRQAEALGLARDDNWSAGHSPAPPFHLGNDRPAADPRIAAALDAARNGESLGEADVERLFAARGDDFSAVCAAADELRATVCGEQVSFVVNRNINYTNLCRYKCKFCAFSKGKTSETLRGAPYVLNLDEIVRRADEAWQRGATEVCLQGGIHPDFNGRTYLEICRAIKEVLPDMHIHAFSALEVTHGAETLGLSIEAFLRELQQAGLGSLPGTAAEILDDEVRAKICPDKLRTAEWLDVLRTAHGLGLPTTSTIMFGHLETPRHWARHLLALRALQQETGGITEFVPLPFVHGEAPMYRRGLARRGPTWRETLLMHAVGRLVLHPLVDNIQVSWVKVGPDGLADALRAGVNDLGGTLMNESISRAAGASHGQELPPHEMQAVIRAAGRQPRQRTTLYTDAPAERIAAARSTPPLSSPEQMISAELLYRRSA
jgi:FO synthase